jgi:hypothetical protein
LTRPIKNDNDVDTDEEQLRQERSILEGFLREACLQKICAHQEKLGRKMGEDKGN